MDIGGIGRYRGWCVGMCGGYWWCRSVSERGGSWLEEDEEKKHLIRGFEGPVYRPFEEWEDF